MIKVMKPQGDENSKQKILNAAAKLFAEQGFNGTSIRDICKLANVNLCLVSYYWGGKKELYYGIIDDLIERQTQYAKTFLNLDEDIEKLTKTEQINLLFTILDKFIEFFYTNISSDLIVILLKEQQKRDFTFKSPAFKFLRKLLSLIFEKDENNRELIYKTLFIVSQINSPRILPAFSLMLLNQEDYTVQDIEIIRNNVKAYVKMLLKEDGIA